MTVIPRRDDDIRFVPPERDDESEDGIREGDDGDFAFAIWALAHEFAEESVGTLNANLIADKIMDGAARIRRRDPTFLEDHGARRAYVLRAVVNEMRATHKATQLHVNLHAMYAPLIEVSTAASRPFPAPDAREVAALREDENSEMMEYVGRAIDDLPPKCHAVVYFTYVEGLKPREVAKKADIKPGSVRSHLRRAHERVREAVRQYLIDKMPRTNT